MIIRHIDSSCQTDIEFVFHVSDIHIRLHSRQEEYQFVFDEFFREMDTRRSENAIIVITGDVLHNKIDLQPECMTMVWEFLNRCSQYFPTFLIAGNHDALLNNTDRMDSLTSILYKRHPENLYYMRESGIYRFRNVSFIVNSLLDDTEWIMCPPKSNDETVIKTIGLYHGQVRGWTNVSRFRDESSSITCSHFEGCEFVMLGDIHYHQFLSKNIAYAGSMISQNFGETDLNHGFLIWNLVTGDTEFVRLKNPFAHIDIQLFPSTMTMIWNDQIVSIDTPPSDFPYRGNVRISFPHHDHYPDQQSCIRLFRKRFKGVRVQVSTIGQIEERRVDKDNVVAGDEQWMKEYVEMNCGEDAQEILQRLTDPSLQWNDANRGRWELLEVRFGNMFGYDDPVHLSFEKLPSHTITGIFGPNSSGKSSLLDVITFLLFGKLTRSVGIGTPKEIIHFDEKNAWGEVRFRIGERVFRVNKTLTRSRDSTKIKITDELWDDNSTPPRKLTEEQRKRTEKLVHGMIGSFRTFCFTNFFLQQREESFREMKQANRKDFLYEIFGLQWFDKYKKELEDELKETRGQEKLLHNRVQAYDMNSADEIEEYLNNKYTIERNKKKDWDTDRNRIQKQKDAVLRLMEPEDVDIISLERSKSQLSRLMEDNNRALSLHLSTGSSVMESGESSSQYLVDKRNDIIRSLREKEKDLLMYPVIESSHDLFTKYGPDHSDHETWRTFFDHVEKLWKDSDSIISSWNTTEKTIMTEIQNLRQNLYFPEPSSPNHTLSFERLKHSRDRLQKLIDETPIISNVDEIVIDELMTRLRALRPLCKEYDETKCRLFILKQSVDEGIGYNPDCEQCMKHPMYIERTERLKTIKKLQMTLRRIEKKTLSSNPETVMNELENQLQELVDKRKRYIETTAKINRAQNELDEIENAIRFYHNQRTRVRIDQLEKDLEDNPIKQQAMDIMSHTRLYDVYKTIDRAWEMEFGRRVIQDDMSRYQKDVDEIDRKMRYISSYEERVKKWKDEEMALMEKKQKLQMEYDKVCTMIEKGERQIILKTEYEQYERDLQNLSREQQNYEENIRMMETERQRLYHLLHTYENDTRELKDLDHKKKRLERMIAIVDRNGLPLFLLSKKMKKLEDHMNELLLPFFGETKKLRLYVDEKDVILGLVSDSSFVTSFMGGMECFIVDLIIKITFSRFAQLPQSNFFIIDEGISVLDQDRLRNLDVLFDFLSTVTEHTMLVSHLPNIGDFVHQAIRIRKNGSKSVLQHTITN